MITRRELGDRGGEFIAELGALGGRAKADFGIDGKRREALAGYLFLLPWTIGFIVFVAGPLLASGALSFTSFDVARDPGAPEHFA